MQPLICYRDGEQLILLDGERRYWAAKEAGWEKIAVIIEDKELSPGAVTLRQLIANLQSAELSPVEEAKGIESLMKDTGYSASQAAQKLGLENASVTRSLALLKLSPQIQLQIDRGEIPASAGYALSRIEDDTQRDSLARELAQGRLTRDGLIGIVKRKGRTTSRPEAGPVTRVAAPLGGGRTVTISGQGLASLETLITWLEELLAKARKVRPQGVELQTFARLLRDQAKSEFEAH